MNRQPPGREWQGLCWRSRRSGFNRQDRGRRGLHPVECLAGDGDAAEGEASRAGDDALLGAGRVIESPNKEFHWALHVILTATDLRSSGETDAQVYFLRE